MNYRQVGHSDLNASVVALGTWSVGGGPWWGDSDDAESIRAIHASLDAGVNLIDTAPVYGFGHSEEIVGRALAGRRDDALIATKCGLWWGDDTGALHFEQNGRTVRRCLEPRTLRIEVEDSLRRLGTDRIDLMQTHAQATEPFKTPIEDTMACLMALRQQGKIREIGVSNCTPAQMDEYRAAGVIVTNQPRYSMLDRTIERDLLPYCMDHAIAILAYSPLEQGLLTGKIGMDTVFPPEAFRNKLSWFAPERRRGVLDLLAGWQPLTESYGCTLAQLVIAWTVAQPGITVALCGARKAANAIENAEAGALAIEPSDLARMRRDIEALAPLEP
ncbi:MAG: aldo/keto reductase [Kiritimatiellia bacterium]|jgi:methylglyoxal reductase|nr:aldo/keto reductase [Kiritimatiellia bacterium]